MNWSSNPVMWAFNWLDNFGQDHWGFLLVVVAAWLVISDIRRSTTRIYVKDSYSGSAEHLHTLLGSYRISREAGVSTFTPQKSVGKWYGHPLEMRDHPRQEEDEEQQEE